MFVIGISAWYILKGRDLHFAKRSFAIAAGFGLASALSVIVLGDESGYELGDVQKVKLAAIEAEYHTQPAPADFNLIGLPNDEEKHVDYAVKIPWVMGLITTRSVDEEVLGLNDLADRHEARIRSGMIAYDYLTKLRAGDKSEENKAMFNSHKADLGYGLLLKRYTDNPTEATEEMIKAATEDSIPSVPYLFWSFRIMVGFGFLMLAYFGLSFYFTAKGIIEKKTLASACSGLLYSRSVARL